MPQLEQINTFISQIFWLFVCFGLVYYFLSKFAVPKLGKVIESRQLFISSNINSAEAFKDNALKISAEYQSKYEAAKTQAFTLITSTSKEAAKSYDKGINEAEIELKKQVELAEKDINLVKEKAVADLKNNIPAFVDEITQKISGVKSDKASLKKLVVNA